MKITKEQQEQGQELLKDLITRAWKDNSFKEKLVAAPRAEIEKFADEEMNLPDNTSIVVEDQTNPSMVYLNIPAKPNFDELELTDEQLEIVAGGEIGLVVAGVALFCIGVYLGYNSK